MELSTIIRTKVWCQWAFSYNYVGARVTKENSNKLTKVELDFYILFVKHKLLYGRFVYYFQKNLFYLVD